MCALLSVSPQLLHVFRTANDFWHAMIMRDFGFVPNLAGNNNNSSIASSASANCNTNSSNNSNSNSNNSSYLVNGNNNNSSSNINSSQQDARQFYDLYRRSYAASYNLQFGARTSVALTWKKYRRMLEKDVARLLDWSRSTVQAIPVAEEQDSRRSRRARVYDWPAAAWMSF
jgi:hypothetical protein